MKLLKLLMLLFIAFLFTGCYTQLQHTEKMSRVSDYDAPKEDENRTEEYEEEYAEEEYIEEHIPIYYRDYTVNKYYYGDWYGADFYTPYNRYRPYAYSSHYRHHPWNWHRPYRSSFWVGFSWGSHYDPYYYDPYYYNSFWYSGYPWAYTSGYYGNYGYYGGKKFFGTISGNKNTRYGPRSVGTSRVSDQETTRSRTNATRTNVANSSSSDVRTRSIGVTRSADSNDTRSRANTGSSNARTRGEVQQDVKKQNSTDTVRSRSNNSGQQSSGSVGTLRNRISSGSGTIERVDKNVDELKNKRARTVKSTQNEKKPTFLDRFRSTVNKAVKSSSGNTKTVKSRANTSSTKRKSVTRSRGNKKSSVTKSKSVKKSKSSSSNSRSRGNKSSSRSRSGGDDSSSSRSRGN